MRTILILLSASVAPAFAAEVEIQVIDATELSVAEFLAMAAEARQNAENHDCCDWGGLGCVPDSVRSASVADRRPNATDWEGLQPRTRRANAAKP